MVPGTEIRIVFLLPSMERADMDREYFGNPIRLPGSSLA
jgi:hypothetical protein